MRTLICITALLLPMSAAYGQLPTENYDTVIDPKEELALYFVAYAEMKAHLDECIDLEEAEVTCRPERHFPDPQDIHRQYIIRSQEKYLCYDVFVVEYLNPHSIGRVLAVDDSLQVMRLRYFPDGTVDPLRSCGLEKYVTEEERQAVIEQTLKLLQGEIEIQSVELKSTTGGFFGRALVERTVTLYNEVVDRSEACLQFAIPEQGYVEVTECET